MKNSLRGSEVNNDPLKAKVVVPAAFLPAAPGGSKKAGQFFSELRSLPNSENLLGGSRIQSKKVL